MIPEEVLLNAAENITTNLERLTNLEVKYNTLRKFGRKMIADTVTGDYSSLNDALLAAFNLFYLSSDTCDIASAQANAKTYLFIKNRNSVYKLCLFDASVGKYYDVTISSYSDPTYTYEELFVQTDEIESTYLTPLHNTIISEYQAYVSAANLALKTYILNKADEDHQSMMTSLTAVDTALRERIDAILNGADADFDTFIEVSTKMAEMLEEDDNLWAAIQAAQTSCVSNANGTVTHTLIDNQSVNFTASEILVMNITIPVAEHGFTSYISFKGTTSTVFSIVNTSGLTAIWLKNSALTDAEHFNMKNALYNILFESNGANIYIRIEEIEE